MFFFTVHKTALSTFQKSNENAKDDASTLFLKLYFKADFHSVVLVARVTISFRLLAISQLPFSSHK